MTTITTKNASDSQKIIDNNNDNNNTTVDVGIITVNQTPIAALTFKDINYHVAGKHVLKGVSGCVKGGELFAIMGCSGAGKSTLLDILASRAKSGKVTGSSSAVLRGGSSVVDILKVGAGIHKFGKDEYNDIGQLSGYVTQSDSFPGNLTVNEHISYTQRLLTGKHDQIKIDEILAILDLLGVKESRIGSKLQRGISGGEARRLSIAIGLLYSPAILFVDEPTTNLDSLAAFKCMKALKAVCARGQTVVCSIHQPRSNIFVLFDNLLLLHKGKTIFSGRSDQSVSFFNHYLKRPCPSFQNPADFFLDMLEEDVNLADKFENNDVEDEDMIVTEPSKGGKVIGLTERRPSSGLMAGGLGVSPSRSSIESNGSGSSSSSYVSGNSNGSSSSGDIEENDYEEVDSDNECILDMTLVDEVKSLKKRKFVSFNEEESLPTPAEFATIFRASSHNYRLLESIEEMEQYSMGANLLQPKTKFSIGGGCIAFYKQLYILLGRTWKEKRRNKIQMYIRTLGCMTLALALGFVLRSERNAYNAWDRVNAINFGITVFLLFGVPAINKFIEDRVVFWADRSANLYGTLAYYMAVVLIEVPILIMMSVTYCSVNYWLVGMKPTAEAFLFFVGVFTLVLNIGCAVCEILAAVITKSSLAIVFYMIFVAYQMLFGGFIIAKNKTNSHLGFLFESSSYYQATRALFVNEFENEGFYRGIFHTLNFKSDEQNKMWYLMLLGSQFLFYRTVAYLFLRFFNSEKR